MLKEKQFKIFSFFDLFKVVLTRQINPILARKSYKRKEKWIIRGHIIVVLIMKEAGGID